jgi:endonuclease/exonuclease/phosphatase family metal-dependent hydrolase
MVALPVPWPLIIGDFNVSSHALLHDLNPDLRIHPATPSPSHPPTAPTEPIDYCICPSNDRVQVRVLGNEGSDHLPVLGTRLPT